MLALAGQKAAAQGVEVDWLAGDMRSFQLEAPVDMAICMFDAIDALLENDDITQHFCTVAANLKPGGFYLIEYTHPRDCSLNNYGTFSYSGERDGIRVDIIWATNDPIFDVLSEVANVEIEVRINENGKLEVIKDKAKERRLSPQQIRLLAELSGALDVIPGIATSTSTNRSPTRQLHRV